MTVQLIVSLQVWREARECIDAVGGVRTYIENLEFVEGTPTPLICPRRGPG